MTTTMTRHERYGPVSEEQLAAYRECNVSPDEHEELADYFRGYPDLTVAERSAAITVYVLGKGRNNLNFGEVWRDMPDNQGNVWPNLAYANAT